MLFKDWKQVSEFTKGRLKLRARLEEVRMRQVEDEGEKQERSSKQENKRCGLEHQRRRLTSLVEGLNQNI